MAIRNNAKNANVKFKRKELIENIRGYLLIQHCLAGQETIKKQGVRYLPKPNPSDVSDENAARYTAYVLRALFLNVASRTLEGLLGQVFTRDPKEELPESMSVMAMDANGEGLSLTQLAKRACRTTFAYGRSGLFTDYPVTGNGVTIKEARDGNIRPIIRSYYPWHCINWRTKVRGAKKILSLVVLEEHYDDETDEFQIAEAIRYRVLRLGPSSSNVIAGIVDNPDVYTVEVWGGKGTQALTITESYQPTDASGKYFDEIPFTFIGSENNDIDFDKAPLLDLCEVNIAHYRNSADNEESSYITGQPTVAIGGLTQNWVTNVFKGKPIELGSRAAIPLPEKGTVSMVQADPNTMPEKGMERKEEQMVAIGAKLVQEGNVEMTATEAIIDKSSEVSILASTAKNVSDAFNKALVWANKFTSTTPEQIEFRLNDDFDISRMSPEEQRQLVEHFQTGGISWTEYRDVLRRNDLVSQDDDEAEKEIKKTLEEKELREAAKLKAQTELKNTSEKSDNE